jgi:hypothetical protein
MACGDGRRFKTFRESFCLRRRYAKPRSRADKSPRRQYGRRASGRRLFLALLRLSALDDVVYGRRPVRPFVALRRWLDADHGHGRATDKVDSDLATDPRLGGECGGGDREHEGSKTREHFHRAGPSAAAPTLAQFSPAQTIRIATSHSDRTLCAILSPGTTFPRPASPARHRQQRSIADMQGRSLIAGIGVQVETDPIAA